MCPLHGGRVERKVPRGFDDFDAVDTTGVSDPDTEEGLTLHVPVPHLKRVFDRDLGRERPRLLNVRIHTARYGRDTHCDTQDPQGWPQPSSPRLVTLPNSYRICRASRGDSSSGSSDLRRVKMGCSSENIES